MIHHLLVPLGTLVDSAPLLDAAFRVSFVSDAHVTVLADVNKRVDHLLEEVYRLHAGMEQMDIEVVFCEETSADVILDVTHQHPIDLIIMGSPCRPGHEHATQQALTEAVVLATTVPVLLLREGVGLRQPTPEHPWKTLVPLDGSQVAEAIIPIASALTAALALPTEGDIDLVRILSSQASGGDHSARAAMLPLHAQVQLYLDALAQGVSSGVAPGMRVATRVLTELDATLAILQLLGTVPATSNSVPAVYDLLAMGVLGPTGNEPQETSSMVKRVLHATTLPLLVKCSRLQLERAHAPDEHPRNAAG